MKEKQTAAVVKAVTYYIYDDEYESYLCDVSMDEDEYMRLVFRYALSVSVLPKWK